ncbi:MAG: MaoC family dehydratase N-terminal domain-containing protein [Pseudomonadota bacterium]
MKIDIKHLRQWIDRAETQVERLAAFPANALAATLDCPDHDFPFADGSPLPPLWHWLHFLPHHRLAETGADGHARVGGFLPPVPLPRRMWAGGRLNFHRPLHIGQTVTRESRVLDVTLKEGRSGNLVFVKVGHTLSGADGVAISEEHDIVYREAVDGAAAAPVAAARPAPLDHAWQRLVKPDPVLLFRYSALTFNSHRIHYDRGYASGVEGYPGLVVHGPLVATLLLELLRRELPGTAIGAFSFRALKPLVDTDEFSVCGAPGDDGKIVRLWTRDSSGAITMEASATLA